MSIERKSSEEIPNSLFNSPDTPDQIGNKTVTKANYHTLKAWFIVAISVGALVVAVVGGFGGIGLLQSHGLIPLPQWLTSAIGTVGNTPHFWSLWAMTTGSIVTGGALIALGASKVHQARLTNNKLKQPRLEQKKSEQERLKLKKHEQLETSFGDNFKKLDVNPVLFQNIAKGLFICVSLGTWEEDGKKFILEDRPDKFLIIRNTHEGILQCTIRITEKQLNELSLFLTQPRMIINSQVKQTEYKSASGGLRYQI